MEPMQLELNVTRHGTNAAVMTHSIHRSKGHIVSRHTYGWTKGYLCEVVASQLFERAMHVQVLSSIADTGLV